MNNASEFNPDIWPYLAITVIWFSGFFLPLNEKLILWSRKNVFRQWIFFMAAIALQSPAIVTMLNLLFDKESLSDGIHLLVVLETLIGFWALLYVSIRFIAPSRIQEILARRRTGGQARQKPASE